MLRHFKWCTARKVLTRNYDTRKYYDEKCSQPRGGGGGEEGGEKEEEEEGEGGGGE